MMFPQNWNKSSTALVFKKRNFRIARMSVPSVAGGCFFFQPFTVPCSLSMI